MEFRKIHLHLRNILFSLIIIYFSQGSLYTQGGIISQLSLLLIYIISGYYFGKSFLLINKDRFYKIWTIFFIFNVVGFSLTTTVSNSVHFGMLKAILMTFLLFYPFYYFTRNGILRPKHLLIFFYISIPITILTFYFNQSNILATRLSGREDVVNNITFTFARLIPFVFLFKNKRMISSASLMLLVYFVILGSKRGTLIAAIAGAVIFAYYQLSISDKKHKVRDYIIGGIFVIVLGYFLINEYLLSRMTDLMEGNSSGRDTIFSNLLKSWYNSDSYVNLFFGFGFGSSLYLSGTGNIAHNDFLEILSNFGIIGLSLYLLLLYQVFKYIFDKSNNKQHRMLMLASISVWILIGLTARSYYAMDSYLHSMIFAYLFGSNNIKNVD